jgi:2,3-bisphosphoglycerate-independent phosphoglycerate mutase
VHAFTDGRDTPPRAAKADVGRFLAALPESVSIGTVCGRYYAMDRDNHWQRVEKAYRVMVQADGPRFPDVLAVITDAHQKDIWDEFIMPAVVGA